MTVRNLLIIQAIIEVGWGLTVLLLPSQVLSPAGAILTEKEGVLFARMFGVAIISLGWLSWSARAAATSDLWPVLLSTFLFFQLLLFIVLLIAQVTGVRTAWGWSVVGLHFLLAAGFGYFRLRA